MNRHRTSILIIPVILLLIGAGTLSAQESSSDWNLSMLRGTWVSHTYYDAWKLIFLNDSELMYNDRKMPYELTTAGIVTDPTSPENAWKFHFDGDQLVITIPPDGERTFEQKSGGSAEASLNGRFVFEAPDSVGGQDVDPLSWITFDGGHSFTGTEVTLAGNDSLITRGISGVYRITGSTAHLVYNDGTYADISLFPPDEDGMITRLIYNGSILTDRLPVQIDPIRTITIVADPAPIPCPFPGPIPGPGPYPGPDPGPYPGNPPPGPGIPITHIAPQPPPQPSGNQGPSRDFGSTRGDQQVTPVSPHRDTTNRDRR